MGGGVIISGGTITGTQVIGAGTILALFMTNEQIKKIADHVVNDHADRYPGQSSEQIQSRIRDVLNNFQDSELGQVGRQIWRLGKDVLINDGKGGGTMLPPDIGAAAYVLRWLAREFGL